MLEWLSFYGNFSKFIVDSIRTWFEVFPLYFKLSFSIQYMVEVKLGCNQKIKRVNLMIAFDDVILRTRLSLLQAQLRERKQLSKQAE